MHQHHHVISRVLNVSQASTHRMELVIIALIAVEVVIVSLALATFFLEM